MGGGSMTATRKSPYTTRPIPADVLAALEKLQPGQRLRITQTVKVGSTKTWTFSIEGTFRHADSWQPAWRQADCRRTTSWCR